MLKKLIEKRGAALNKIDAILAKADAEKRDLNEAETAEYRSLTDEVNGLKQKIADAESLAEARKAQEDAEKRGAAPSSRPIVGDVRTGLSEKEERDVKKFSYVRAIGKLLDGDRLDGIEAEMHAEGTKEMRESGASSKGGNLVVPQIVLTRAGKLGSMERRGFTVTGQTSVAGDQGGMTVQTDVGSLIDRLRAKLIFGEMGATYLGGLVGNIDFPKFIPNDNAANKAETGTSNESSPTFGKVSLKPRRLPVFMEASTQFFAQTTVDADALFMNDMAYQIAAAMETGAINGSGTGENPTGILNTVGIGSVPLGTDGGAPTWAGIVNLETAIAAVNADVGALGYLTNTKVRGKLKQTLINGSTNAQMIWDRLSPATPLNEYKVGVTNLVPSNLTKGTGTGLSALIFGNFADALFGQWGGLEFLVNPYSKDTQGIVRVNCWTFWDFVVRRAESFAASKDVITA